MAHPPPSFRTDAAVTFRHRLDHALARWGYRRHHHRVEPGLWALGDPGPDSPVLVTANYTLSFDALRAALAGRRAWILVLDTQGINVWCAAGKGTFGTAELLTRLGRAGLAGLVTHRRLIVPQLGASGVAADEVERISGFRVEFGPVRASDLPAYLDRGEATPAMRRVTFSLAERLVLIPMEMVTGLPWLGAAMILLFLLGGWTAALSGLAAYLAGTVLFPLLLPRLPSRDFFTKGYLLGVAATLPTLLWLLSSARGRPWWLSGGAALTALLAMPPVTAFLALNFTGATTFTSPTAVRREIFTWIRPAAWLTGTGLAVGTLSAVAAFTR
jgi:hypothetical protein